jgi:hypothetical protein
MNKLALDPAEIRRAWGVLSEPGDVRELRVLDAVTASDRRPHTESGYFDNADDLVQAALSIKNAKGFYLTVNPVKPALLARAKNRIRPVGKEPLTSDRDILKRCWLPIDLDAERPAGISSSEEEHQAALDHAIRVRDAMTAMGWPEPILADSGNGAHLLYRVDLPTDDGGLIQRCLNALAARFNIADVKVDTTTFNPARIWKLYGTPAGKGDSTEDRPHRLARLLCVPSNQEAVACP